MGGLGRCGGACMVALDRGMDGLELVAAPASQPDKHREFLAELSKPPLILPIAGLAEPDRRRVSRSSAPPIGTIQPRSPPSATLLGHMQR